MQSQGQAEKARAGEIGVALLYQPFRIAVFDYTKRDAMTGRYAVEVFCDKEIEKMGEIRMNQLEQAG